MKKLLKFIGILAGLAIVGVAVIFALLPWMDRWGATESEMTTSFPGDELILSPVVTYTRAVTVHATAPDIYPWLVQMGAEKGGMYSYSWFETNILQCELINADRIHEEWQGLKVGDKVKMCPGESGPPAYDVAFLEPNQVVVLGHQENETWTAIWQFILVPQTDGTTRLITRARESKSSGIWNIIRPGQFIMERGMLLGIKERAEALAKTRSVSPVPEVTPTPEVFIPLDEAIPEYGITLQEVHLDIINSALDKSFPAGCLGEAPACLQAQSGNNFLSVTFKPRDLPEGQMLAYKNLPAVSVAMEGGLSVPYSLTKYDNAAQTLTVGFEVPQSAKVFGLKWADLVEIPLDVVLPASHLQTIAMSEFGQNISLSYDPSLVSNVEVETVPAVPVSDQILFAESHPVYAQIRFLGFLDGKLYDLPFLPSENRVAQVIVFRTADFPGFGDESLQGFVNQRQALQKVLERGIAADHCTKPLITYEAALPFLPWTNARQSLCAQPQIIEFAGGKGIRYLTYYAQDPSPVLDYQVFYTFQGLTQDGQFYVAAFFPVRTGIFPAKPPACTRCGESNYNPTGEWMTLLTEQLTELNALPGENFTPSLVSLDEIVRSIQIAQK